MSKTRKYITAILMAVLISYTFMPPTSVVANDHSNDIEVISTSIKSEFPEAFRIKLEASGKYAITSIAIRLRIGQRKSGAYNYLCQAGEQVDVSKWLCEELIKDKNVSGELLWRTNTASRYIPPGTIITYYFEIEDSTGAILETNPEEFIYYDSRFLWSEIVNGPVTVSYHGPVKTRAEMILEATTKTLAHMGLILGAGTKDPIRVTMYNNTKEMLDGLPPGSTTISRELITEGQAFSELGTLLVLGGDRRARGTASHEVTHILVHRAGRSIYREIPSWLNEGLAEYGNIESSFSYDIALEFAVANKRLLPVMFMSGLPGKPEDVIIFYGQSKSIVNLIIEMFGTEKMAELMLSLKNGKSTENAIREVYNLELLELTNIWRESIGAEKYELPDQDRSVPTPLPMREIKPFSLTEHPEAEVIGESSSHDLSEPNENKSDITESSRINSSCTILRNGNSNVLDITIIGFLIGMVGLKFRKMFGQG